MAIRVDAIQTIGAMVQPDRHLRLVTLVRTGDRSRGIMMGVLAPAVMIVAKKADGEYRIEARSTVRPIGADIERRVPTGELTPARQLSKSLMLQQPNGKVT